MPIPKFLTILLVSFGIALTANARTDSDVGTVTLAWNPNPEPNVSGYNVHFGTESGNYSTVLNAGSNSELEVPDLQPNVTYYCAVTAYNTIGLESAFSAEVEITYVAEGGQPNGGRLILLEAESGELSSPMVIQGSNDITWVQDDSLSQQGATEISFTSQVDTGYYVWCRLRAPSSGSDSYFVSVDGGSDEVFHVYGTQTPHPSVYTDEWTWRRINASSGEAQAFQLAPGSHTIRFRTREAGVNLDRVVLCSDPNFFPDDSLPRAGEALAISGSPTDKTVHAGGSVTFDVAAAATGAINYQWVKDGLAINGETGPSLRIEPADYDDAADYSVFIWSNTVIRSAGPASLSVIEPPFRITQMSVGADRSVTFSLSGQLGQEVEIHATSDLEDWSVISTQVNQDGIIAVDDPGAVGQQQRYYKLVIPNP